MDDPQQSFASQQLTAQYPFDLDLMKRSMDSVGGPESIKKPRWSPTSFPSSATSNPPSARTASFENYGYGPFANQTNHTQSAPQQLYSTAPTLTVNTAQISNNNGIAAAQSANSQTSPHSAAFVQQNGVNGNSPASPFAAAAAAGAYAGLGNFNPYAMGGMMNIPNLGGMGMFGGMGLGAYGFSPQSASFQQAFQQQQVGRIPSMGLQVPQSAYSPAAAAAAAAAANNATGRTVYVGNLPADASVDELLNLVRFGPLESVRVLPEKSCVFISFLDGATAAAFHADATVKKLSLHGQELKIGWGKPSPVPSQVMLSIAQSNASRNVYLGGLDESTTEELLRDELSRFGLIDQVKIVRDKNIGFVHFLSIAVATKVVATLPTEPAWAGKRVSYGKDRCAYIPKAQQAAAAAAQAAAAQSLVAQSAAASLGAFPPAPFSPYGAVSMPDTTNSAAILAGVAAAQGLNRTVYLGNIHPETTTEDLCNAIRGGMLQSIRYMQDKHIAFVTFIDPAAAFTFYQVASYQGLTLNSRRLKIGWGKNSGPLAPAIALAVHSGATRNVYIGNVEDFDSFNEERLKRDFGEFGDIELVNFLREKNCAFVNFTNVSNAIKAIENIKTRPDYANLRIAHGKDRCANPPRSGPQGGGRKASSGMATSPSGEGMGEDSVGEEITGADDLDGVDEEEVAIAVGASVLDDGKVPEEYNA